MLKPSIFTFALMSATTGMADISIQGTLKKWHPITIDNNSSVVLSESQYQPNPFLDYRFDVIFTSPGGTEYTVPGFFAGNGQGFGIGSVWRARFSADEVGEWQYRISFRKGDDVAVSQQTDAGIAMPSDGETGTFSVSPQSGDDPGFLPYGRLEYVGKHYLKHADGSYWIKGGVDSPENFLGYAGFDNTVDQPGGAGTDGLQDGVHRYPTHAEDWQEGDPLFDNSSTPDSARAIIGAINYLSSEAVNSMYFLPMNLGGDGRETYPFIKPSGSRFDNTHYDISKLYQWGIVLDHMQNKGIAPQIVLAEMENENTDWFDGGELGVERKLFYREMIARYSHLLGLKWIISEESRYSQEAHREFAAYISELDWADHPIAVHSTKNAPNIQYDGIIGDPLFTASSIQFSPEHSSRYVEEWRQKSADAGWPWVLDMDEPGNARDGVNEENTEARRREVLYPVYFSGGNLEWYFGYHPLPRGGDMRTEDFRTRQQMYRYMRYAREMMHAELPFWEMAPDDTLHSASDSDTVGVEVFAKPGSVYAVYLTDASDSGTLSVSAGEYQLRWFNPRDGQFAGDPITLEADESIALGDAPFEPAQDWVVLVKSTDYVHQPPVPLVDTQAPPVETPDNTEDPEESTDNTESTDDTESTDGSEERSETSADSGGALGLSWLLLLLIAANRRRLRRRNNHTRS